MRNQRGQIAVEYILLLLVGIAVATLIVSQFVSRNPESPRFLVQKWQEIITLIGEDPADDLQQEDN